MLTKKKIPHEVLNAKNHAREAEIIAHAGEKVLLLLLLIWLVVVPILNLVKVLKNLVAYVLSVVKDMRSRRIDNQLRGRSGRQGDPGFTQFFVSFEDELLVRFGSDRYRGMLANLGFTGDHGYSK